VDASDLLRSFRRNAVHVRQGLSGLEAPASAAPFQVDGGYLQDASLVERYKRLSIPVRRALNPTDRAAFTQALEALKETAGVDREARKSAEAAWQRLQQELDSQIGLGGGRVPRRQILAAWLEAAAFYDKLDRDRAYDHLIEQWGKAAENIGAQLMEDAARVVVSLDDVIAAALDEPAILPPPPKTPPPPKDPDERWWKRLFR
jgi:hypothetical protein